MSERSAGRMGLAATSPVVQSEGVDDQYSAQRLIAKMPIEYIMNKEANDVPVMMGANRDEGSLALGSKELYCNN